MNPRLLDVLDEFRELWGAPCRISPHPDALGRHLGDSESQHNVDRYNTVNACDFFPEGMNTESDLKRAFECAKEAGASGIGLYVDTKPSNMMHLDVRPDRTSEDPAKWARVGGEYVEIERVF